MLTSSRLCLAALIIHDILIIHRSRVAFQKFHGRLVTIAVLSEDMLDEISEEGVPLLKEGFWQVGDLSWRTFHPRCLVGNYLLIRPILAISSLLVAIGDGQFSIEGDPSWKPMPISIGLVCPEISVVSVSPRYQHSNEYISSCVTD